MAADPNAVPGWQGRLVALLQRAKRYPDLARSAGDEGVALVSFTMDRAGHVLSVRVVRSAGDPALDEEAVRWCTGRSRCHRRQLRCPVGRLR